MCGPLCATNTNGESMREPHYDDYRDTTDALQNVLQSHMKGNRWTSTIQTISHNDSLKTVNGTTAQHGHIPGLTDCILICSSKISCVC